SQAIKTENKVKFLGVWFDSRLQWNVHVDYIITKCKKRLNLMRSLTDMHWGASKKTLVTIYRALVRSIIDYGAAAYNSANKSAKAKLDVLQSSALRICCSTFRGTARSVLQNECGEPPLELRRLRQQLRYAMKIKACNQHPNEAVVTDHWAFHYGNFGYKN